jgi:hypothetical protein
MARFLNTGSIPPLKNCGLQLDIFRICLADHDGKNPLAVPDRV